MRAIDTHEPAISRGTRQHPLRRHRLRDRTDRGRRASRTHNRPPRASRQGVVRRRRNRSTAMIPNWLTLTYHRAVAHGRAAHPDRAGDHHRRDQGATPPPMNIDDPPGWLAGFFHLLAWTPAIILFGGLILFASAIAAGFLRAGWAVLLHVTGRRPMILDAGYIPRRHRAPAAHQSVQIVASQPIYAADDELPLNLPTDAHRPM